MTETRQTFAGLAHWEIVFWYALIAVSTLVFALGVARLVLRYLRGRRDRALVHKWMVRRLVRAAAIVFTHRWVRRRDPVAGVGHLLIFYGFLVLFVGTVILSFQEDVAKPLFGFDFWHGGFYLGYSLVLDVLGLALAAGLAVMAVKRARRPRRLDYTRPDRDEDRRLYVVGDWVFLGTLFFLALTGFLLEAFRIAQTNPSFETWSPIGWAVGRGFHRLGMTAQEASSAHFATWWTHGVVALAFVSSIPFTKAVHMLAGPANVAVRDERAGKRLPETVGEPIGYTRIGDLTVEHLLSLDACTKCGKCHVACPANAGGYPLSPRDVILDLRELSAHGGDGATIGDRIRPETLWSCTQCMACV